MAFALRLRGHTVLHGNVVVVEDRALAFLGSQGAGKSTLTAEFLRQGYPLLSDDLVVVDRAAEEVQVQPGLPRLRLWPSSLSILGENPADHPRVFSAMAKRLVRLDSESKTAFYPTAARLGGIYVLEPRDQEFRHTLIQDVTLRAALHRLIGNRHSTTRLWPELTGGEFAHLGRIAREIPVRLARLPNRIEALPDAVKTILADYRAHVFA